MGFLRFATEAKQHTTESKMTDVEQLLADTLQRPQCQLQNNPPIQNPIIASTWVLK